MVGNYNCISFWNRSIKILTGFIIFFLNFIESYYITKCSDTKGVCAMWLLWTADFTCCLSTCCLLFSANAKAFVDVQIALLLPSCYYSKVLLIAERITSLFRRTSILPFTGNLATKVSLELLQMLCFGWTQVHIQIFIYTWPKMYTCVPERKQRSSCNFKWYQYSILNLDEEILANVF